MGYTQDVRTRVEFRLIICVVTNLLKASQRAIRARRSKPAKYDKNNRQKVQKLTRKHYSSLVASYSIRETYDQGITTPRGHPLGPLDPPGAAADVLVDGAEILTTATSTVSVTSKDEETVAKPGRTSEVDVLLQRDTWGEWTLKEG